jgi:hypothetical protein
LLPFYRGVATGGPSHFTRQLNLPAEPTINVPSAPLLRHRYTAGGTAGGVKGLAVDDPLPVDPSSTVSEKPRSPSRHRPGEIDVFRIGEPDLPQAPGYGEIGLYSQHIPIASGASSFRPSCAAAAASQTKLDL